MCAATLAVVVAAPAQAATVSAGDVLLADYGAEPGGNGAVFDLNPANGAQAVVSQDGDFSNPVGVARTPEGTIVVVDDIAFKLIKVDPATGAQTTVATYDGVSQFPISVAVGPDGATYVGVDAGTPLVERVDLATGARTTVASLSGIGTISGIAFAPAGTLMVGDFSGGPGGKGQVVRVDMATGSQQVISSGGIFDGVSFLAAARDGSVLVSNTSGGTGSKGSIVRVNPATGQQTLVSEGGYFDQGLAGIGLEASGQIMAADYRAVKVLRVDPATGAQSVVSAGGGLVKPNGIAVVPNPPVTTISSPAEGTVTANATPSFDFSANQADSAFACRIDGGSYSTCTTGFAAGTLADGSHKFEARATNPGNQTEPTPAARNIVVDTTVPNVKSFRASPARFTAAALAVSAKAKRGTRFTFKLSEAASVKLTIDRLSCKKHGKRRKSCRVGTITRTNGKAGRNRIRFSGKLHGRKLGNGRYRAAIVATDSVGNKSKARRTRFKVLRH